MAQMSSPTSIEPLRSMETGGFLLTERVHSPNWVLTSHAHESTIIGIVYKGSYTEIIGRRSQECGTHSLQLLPAGEHHIYKFGTAHVRCLAIDIKLQKLEELRQFSKILDHAIHIPEGMLSAPVTRLYKEFRLRDSTSVLTVEGLILEMLGVAARRNDRCTSLAQPRWLRQAKDFIHENATEGVSLISVAVSVGVHPTYLARMFRKFYNCSVGDYVRRIRLDHAVRELTTSDKPLAEIASASGFYDQSHLTNTFKLHMKMTPAEFRTVVQATNTKQKGCDFPIRNRT